MSGKDQSVVSKEALMSTKSGKQIIKQGLFKSKGFKLFNQYKEEAESEFPKFAQRFTDDLLREIKNDSSPSDTQKAFSEEVCSTEIILENSEIPKIKSKLENPDVLKDRVLRILNSNFVKMTLPVFCALYDGAANYTQTKSAQMRQDRGDGQSIARERSEPRERRVDKEEEGE